MAGKEKALARRFEAQIPYTEPVRREWMPLEILREMEEERRSVELERAQRQTVSRHALRLRELNRRKRLKALQETGW